MQMFRWINNLFVFLATFLHHFGSSILKGVGRLFLSYGVLNDALANSNLVGEWFFTTTLISGIGK